MVVNKGFLSIPKIGDTSVVVCGNHARIPHTIAVVKATAMVSFLQNNLKIISFYYHGFGNKCDGISLQFFNFKYLCVLPRGFHTNRDGISCKVSPTMLIRSRLL